MCRAGIAGEIEPIAGDSPSPDGQSAALRARIENHKSKYHVFEWRTGDGRQVLVNEQHTSDGGTVVLYTETSKRKG